MRSRYGHGAVAIRSRFGRVAVEVRSRYGHGTVEVRSCGRGAVKVLSRYAPSSLVVRYTQGSFPPCILDAPRTWYTYSSFYCSNRGLAGFGSAIVTIPLIRNVFAA